MVCSLCGAPTEDGFLQVFGAEARFQVFEQHLATESLAGGFPRCHYNTKKLLAGAFLVITLKKKNCDVETLCLYVINLFFRVQKIPSGVAFSF